MPPKDWDARCDAAVSSDDSDGSRLCELATYQLSDKQSRRLLRRYRKAKQARTDGQFANLDPFKLAVLTANTFDIVGDVLPVAGLRHGLSLDFTIAPYGQIAQEALDPQSQTNKSGANAALLAIDHRWLGLDQMVDDEQEEHCVQRAVNQIEAVVEGLYKNSGTPTIISTIPNAPTQSFGSFDRVQHGTVCRMIDQTNERIVALAKRSHCYVFDVAALAQTVGLERWFNISQWNSYKLPFDAKLGAIYCDWLCRILGAIQGKSRKCLVLDLDNTIWGGAIGDDGVEGIVIGEGSARGEAHLAVQKFALGLKKRGIMLAVCSKNDEDTALAAFRDHPDMALKEDDFSAFQANWSDKASNLEAIAKTLNVGLDALVILDDNPAERAHIRARLPMVGVPELPNEPTYYQWLLNAGGYFEVVSFSAEDRLRASAVHADKARTKVQNSSATVGDYLNELGMVLEAHPFDALGRKRITQLVNKTNQFNLTTKRYTEAQIEAFERDPSVYTLQARLSDNFGDLGMISTVICINNEAEKKCWDIDTWLMSCRVLGRGVETAILNKIVCDAKGKGIAKIYGRFVPTPKNAMVASHYESLGFSHVSTDMSGSALWQFDCQSTLPEIGPSSLNVRECEPPSNADKPSSIS
jgi:FkbH-like protein